MAHYSQSILPQQSPFASNTWQPYFHEQPQHPYYSYPAQPPPSQVMDDLQYADIAKYPDPPQHTSSPQHVESSAHPVYASRDDLPRSPSSDYETGNLVQAMPYGSDTTDTEPWLQKFPAFDEDAVAASPGSRQPSIPRSLSTESSSSQPSVKVEPNDGEGCFIMELPPTPTFGDTMGFALSPPQTPAAEIQVRASQAPEEMRKLMGAFRLNPFAMHSGEGKAGSSMPIGMAEPGPLEEEPLLFEFQIAIADPEVGNDSVEEPSLLDFEADTKAKEDFSQLRAFSPEFDLHHDTTPMVVSEPEQVRDDQQDPDIYEGGSDWEDHGYSSRSDVATSSSESIVHTSHSPDHTNVSAMEYAYPIPSRVHRLHAMSSHPYLRRSVLNAQASAAASSSSSPSPRMQSHPLPRPYQHASVLPNMLPTSTLPTHHHHSHSYPSEQTSQMIHPQPHHSFPYTSSQTPPSYLRKAYPESTHQGSGAMMIGSYQAYPSYNQHGPNSAVYTHPSPQCEGSEGKTKYEAIPPSTSATVATFTHAHAPPPTTYVTAPTPRRWSLPETSFQFSNGAGTSGGSFLSNTS